MPREIPLTRGYVALVDDADLALLSDRGWRVTYGSDRNKLYAISNPRIGVPQVRMHRLILDAEAGLHVDHIDGNGLNNQRSNIRLATQSQNLGNRRSAGGETPYKGVHFLKGASRKTPTWIARIQKKYLGSFSTPEDAARAYDRAALETWGEFACTNAMLGLL
jgi:hypothetical protein